MPANEAHARAAPRRPLEAGRALGLGLALLIGTAAVGPAAAQRPASVQEAESGQGGASAQSAAAQAAAAPLARRLDALEHRRSLLEDANDVKRLQRAYGYYVDRGLWDQAAGLFAAGGTIEIGLDGVYVGKARVAQYLHALGRALGGPESGLAHGELNEQLQLMGAVTVAPDGRTAMARWRGLVLAGHLGKDAFWGEGPYENEYVKEDGVWKIKTLHWYQSMLVAYAGGWAKNKDANGARYVTDLTPDRPPTIEYDTWPTTNLPPFDFPNPVIGATPARDSAATPAEGSAAGDTASNTDSANAEGRAPVTPSARSVRDLARGAAVLAQQVELLEDQREIENLQRTYGYYVDKGLWSEAADLFANDGKFEVAGRGVYEGRSHVRAYLKSIDTEGPRYGRLYDRMQLQGIVNVAPDGRTAKGRWHLLAQEADWGKFAQWGLGVYENDYVKQDGVWKIARLRLVPTMYTPYEDGWGKTALTKDGFAGKRAPDAAPTIGSGLYPEVTVVPFHYPNPVTGGAVFSGRAADYAQNVPANVGAAAVEKSLADLDRRIGLLEDAEAVERLHAIYGYYLARNQWDNLAGIFADDGVIEIALRGQYVGHASVRRNLNLYGRPGVQFGLLHNHMQFQPVINVAPDGKSAKMRSRALSIMGNYERLGMWMGGVYENEYVKIDGIWQIKKDQVFNTYFTPYDVGWKNLPQRDPPGVTDSNPPDRPPSIPFAMYPKQFVPPFHYPNPVTGRPVAVPASSGTPASAAPGRGPQ